MTPTDQTRKLEIVLLTAALAIVGFFLEVGPVGGVFSLALGGIPVATALTMELQTLGFFAYLALAAAAAVGLHLSEDEPVPREEDEEQAAGKKGVAREAVRERAPERPMLHQFRMIATAVIGYAALKWVSLILLGQRLELTSDKLLKLFTFGLAFVALGWFVLWQFLRWYAQQRRWVRLQTELMGGDVTKIVAVAIAIKPVVYFVSLTLTRIVIFAPYTLIAVLLHLAVLAGAVLLWLARPARLRGTLTGLLVLGAIIVLLTLALIPTELAAGG